MSEPEWIHCKMPNGDIIGMTLPLHPTIEQQWQNGDLQQVNEDGTPWTGAAAEPEEPSKTEGDTTEPDAPTRPRDSAQKREWQAYAVALGVCTEEQAGDLTRAQLIELTTPPEMQPADPEG